MGKSYSSDLRDRVVGFVEAGGSRRGAARQFGVSNSFAVKLLERSKRFGLSLPPAGPAAWEGQTGSPSCIPGRARGRARGHRHARVVAARLAADRGVKASPASLSRFLLKAGFTYKKSADGIGMRARAHP